MSDTPAPSTPASRAAARRANWTFTRGHAPAVPLDSTPGERLAMVWALTVDAWAMSGKPFPTYSRAETPCSMVRGSAQRAAPQREEGGA
jgi:hypothetical protein